MWYIGGRGRQNVTTDICSGPKKLEFSMNCESFYVQKIYVIDLWKWGKLFKGGNKQKTGNYTWKYGKRVNQRRLN